MCTDLTHLPKKKSSDRVTAKCKFKLYTGRPP